MRHPARSGSIDRARAVSYIPALLVAASLLLPVAARAGEYRHDLGAALPRWAKKIGPHRYRSPWNWELTMRWLRKTYPSGRFPRIRIVNQPGIKAIHVRNRHDRGWSGMNIYAINDGEVRFFVLPAHPAKKKPATPAHASK